MASSSELAEWGSESIGGKCCCQPADGGMLRRAKGKVLRSPNASREAARLAS